MLVFEDVTKIYGERAALRNVSLRVAEGRTMALIGPSGCGKSTLLRIGVGLESADGGRASIDGVEVTPRTIRELRQRIGYVIQEGGLFPHLTARENVALAVRPLGWTADSVESRLPELVRMTHFPPDALDRHPGQLSGGQRQRVSLMRALLPDPKYLLLDEPFGALDPMVRYELQRELKEIVRATGKTVLLVTHDLAEAGFLGDEVALFDVGHIVQVGPFRDLLDAPADPFVTRFVEAQRAPMVATGRPS